MDNLPPLLLAILPAFRPLMRSEVFASFCYLLAGLLIGEAKAGTARASVFAPADYWPQRLSALFCRHKLSGQALMAKLVEVALSHLYPRGLPGRLFWIADATYTEKPYAHHIASVDWFHRLKYVAGRAKNLKGHCGFYFAPGDVEEVTRPPDDTAAFRHTLATQACCARGTPDGR